MFRFQKRFASLSVPIILYYITVLITLCLKTHKKLRFYKISFCLWKASGVVLRFGYGHGRTKRFVACISVSSKKPARYWWFNAIHTTPPKRFPNSKRIPGVKNCECLKYVITVMIVPQSLAYTVCVKFHFFFIV